YIAKGHRNSRLAKDYLLLSSFLAKALEYEEQEEICGSRNSYYKTDHDATAMCLKEDYYSGLGSNMHAAYSAQISVSNGIVTCYYVGQERTDSSAFCALFDRMEANGLKPSCICADAGYGSRQLYSLLEEKGVEAYVKYIEWEGELTGRRPASYAIDDDGVIKCIGGRELKRTEIPNRHPKRAGAEFFVCSDCKGCQFMHYCGRFMSEREGDTRVFEVDVELLRLRQNAKERLLSPKGIEMRVNRSCQVEGAFGMIKQDMRYDRFRRTSLEKARMEFMLYCLGLNIRKLFRFYRGKARFDYWKAPEGLSPEKFKKPSAKRLENKMEKWAKKKKQPNERAKDEYKHAGDKKKGRTHTR
ncbi:MAG: transposase, partial [Bacilli bacterium]|nr:transposase [Bacilli bacterium]